MLSEYLAQVAREPWAWSAPRGDCCTFVADWLVSQGGPDPMATWRGRYDSHETCQAFIDDAGGLLYLWLPVMIQYAPVTAPPYRVGDVAVIGIGADEAGAIFSGERWIVRALRGWAASDVPEQAIRAVWRHG